MSGVELIIPELLHKKIYQKNLFVTCKCVTSIEF